jgi:hypothetical protein
MGKRGRERDARIRELKKIKTLMAHFRSATIGEPLYQIELNNLKWITGFSLSYDLAPIPPSPISSVSKLSLFFSLSPGVE